MPLTPCRQCCEPVDAQSAVCPHCHAPRPALAEWHGEGFEWRSPGQWCGVPVVHVAFGNGADGRPRVARGLIAVGQRAVGGVAVGIVATGFVAIGVVGLGVFSVGVVAVALALLWRYGALDTWVGYHPQLESAILPQVEDLAREMERLLAY